MNLHWFSCLCSDSRLCRLALNLGLVPNCWLNLQQRWQQWVYFDSSPESGRGGGATFPGPEERSFLCGFWVGTVSGTHSLADLVHVLASSLALTFTLSVWLGLPRAPGLLSIQSWSHLWLFPLLVCPSQNGLAVLSLGSDLLKPVTQPSSPWHPGSDGRPCWFLQQPFF